MANISTLFWDIGGVILSNGWDELARADAAQRFSLDRDDYEQRHKRAEFDFETGAITLETYLDQTIFFRERPFSREEFKNFMFAQSKEKSETRALLDELTASRRYLLAAINNESLELNSFRIRKFALARNFMAFFTSCYLRLRKPDPAMFQLVLGITQRPPEQCVFIDDRPKNLEPARVLGMHTILFQSAVQLRASLQETGIERAVVGG
jgi:putative hydrolase of the HAD superfamily